MKRTLLRYLTHIHRWTGVITGALLFVTAVTGFLLTFYRELNLRELQQQQGSEIIDYSPALFELLEQNPGMRWVNVSVPREQADHLTWQVLYRRAVGDDLMLADLDPSTGELFKNRLYYSTPFAFLRKLHYTFYLGTVGKVIGWFLSLVLILLAISGVVINRGAIRDLFRWKLGKHRSVRASVVWLHKWTGLWTVLLSLMWGITGFCYMQGITSNALANRKPFHRSTNIHFFDEALPFSTLHNVADSVFDGANLRSVAPRTGRDGSSQLRFLYFFRNAAPWNQNGEVYVDLKTGDVTRVVQPQERPFRSRYFSTLAFLHFGFNSGRLMQIIWGFGGLVMIWLPVSGFWMWLKRTQRK